MGNLANQTWLKLSDNQLSGCVPSRRNGRRIADGQDRNRILDRGRGAPGAKGQRSVRGFRTRSHRRVEYRQFGSVPDFLRLWQAREHPGALAADPLRRRAKRSRLYGTTGSSQIRIRQPDQLRGTGDPVGILVVLGSNCRPGHHPVHDIFIVYPPSWGRSSGLPRPGSPSQRPCGDCTIPDDPECGWCLSSS